MPCQHHTRCTHVVQLCRLHAAVQCTRTELRSSGAATVMAPGSPKGSHRKITSVTIVTVRFSAGIAAGRRLEPRFLRLTTLGNFRNLVEGK